MQNYAIFLKLLIGDQPKVNTKQMPSIISLDVLLRNMALTMPTKSGGRYTKKEQEERRLKVHHLHFEENKSAVEIAEILKVNRNTINEDINFWFKQISSRINFFDVFSLMAEEIKRKKIQRDRLLEYLDEVETIGEKLKIEKLVYDIGNRLEQFFSKVIFAQKDDVLPTKNEKIEESEIKVVVRSMIFQSDLESGFVFSENEIQYEIVKKTKCNLEYSVHFLKKMKDLGLNLCKKPLDFFEDMDNEKYDLVDFAKLRGYVTISEFEDHFGPKKSSRK